MLQSRLKNFVYNHEQEVYNLITFLTHKEVFVY